MSTETAATPAPENAESKAATDLQENLARFLHEKHGDWRRTWAEQSDLGRDLMRREAATIIQMVSSREA